MKFLQNILFSVLSFSEYNTNVIVYIAL